LAKVKTPKKLLLLTPWEQSMFLQTKLLIITIFAFYNICLYAKFQKQQLDPIHEYIIKLKKTSSFNQAQSNIESIIGKQTIDKHNPGRLLLIELNKNNKDEFVKFLRLKKSKLVQYIIPNIKLHAFIQQPNDPDFSNQWALEKIKILEAWQHTQGRDDITVAVIDTGIDWQHEDLSDRIWSNSKEIPSNNIDDDNNGYIDDIRGWDFFGQGDNDPTDETSSKNPGHGTHCAGIIAASANNDKGVSGVAPLVKLMPIRFLGADGSGNLMSAVKAIDYAINNGAQVISASWGAEVQAAQMKPVLEAIERANKKDIIFVAAAANNGSSNDIKEVYPANAPSTNVISVSASQTNDSKPTWSNFGQATVSLAAPGANILSTLPGNKYGNLSGTSMATPLVAALSALILSQAKNLNIALKPEDIKAILQATGEKVSIETACKCRVSAAKALAHLSERKLLFVPFAKTLQPSETLSLKTLFATHPLTFLSLTPEVISINEKGVITAKTNGSTTISIKDSEGTEIVSPHFYVGKKKAPPKSNCPFSKPIYCEITCKYDPRYPWCS
jgi:thermitase